ncbi:MAG: hypothetical protein IPG54_13830 [Sphingomonadales bacterium]|nr:hypothetical protein [Sphingomonadales bacterium]
MAHRFLFMAVSALVLVPDMEAMALFGKASDRGIACPFLLIAYVPQRAMPPKPGPWSAGCSGS